MGWSPRRAAPSTRLQKYATTSRITGLSQPAIVSLRAAWTTANVSPLVGITSPSSRSGRGFRVAFDQPLVILSLGRQSASNTPECWSAFARDVPSASLLHALWQNDPETIRV